MKPTASYKMSKGLKRSLAKYIDPHKRGEQKRIMIGAELAGQVRHKEKRNTEN